MAAIGVVECGFKDCVKEAVTEVLTVVGWVPACDDHKAERQSRTTSGGN